MTSPHPQRCETCEYTELFNCPLVHKRLGTLSELEYIKRLTASIGCASHSSVQSAAEKVLEELLAWRGEYVKEHGHAPRHKAIWDKIAELRQQGEREHRI